MGLGILPPPGVAPPKAPDVQDFTSSGTWTKPDGASWVWIELVGGGASGSATTDPQGGGGAYFDILVPASALGSTEAVTIAAATSGTARGNNTLFSTFVAPGGANGASGELYNRGVGGGPGGAEGAPNGGKGYYGGGGGGIPSSSGTGGPSAYGAGGGGSGSAAAGGTKAAAQGRLQAGDGAFSSATATAPGGGGYGTGAQMNGARGQVRITTYF